MSDKLHRYEADEIVVSYDAKRCIHAAECVRGLPRVFDPEARPWVSPRQAPASEIAEVVARCPTGALHFERRDGGEAEAVPEANEIQVVPDGPLYVRGDLEITRADGPALRETRAAFCRCGASQNKPFCDNSHLEESFRDAGELEKPSRLKPSEGGSAGGLLTVRVAPNGPLIVEGAMELRSGGGQAPHRGVKGALCRCGASQSKPYCDGSHTLIGFEAE